MTRATTGTLYGVGVGPGDPELLTLKAVRLIRTCPVIAYIANAQGDAMARGIASGFIEAPEHIELPVVMPMCSNRETADRVYDQAAETIAGHLSEGRDTVFLCEGDPLFFGSFAYLYDRLGEQFAVRAVPGVSSVHACSAVAGRALAQLAETVAIVSGRSRDSEILSALRDFDNVAIMKAGRRRRRLVELINEASRTDQACYIEHAGAEGELVVHEIDRLDPKPGPYFSMFLVNRPRRYGNGSRSE